MVRERRSNKSTHLDHNKGASRKMWHNPHRQQHKLWSAVIIRKFIGGVSDEVLQKKYSCSTASQETHTVVVNIVVVGVV